MIYLIFRKIKFKVIFMTRLYGVKELLYRFPNLEISSNKNVTAKQQYTKIKLRYSLSRKNDPTIKEF